MTTAKTTTNRQDIERYIRVDHAGERAAQQIYRGQLVVLDKHPMGEEIRHMMAQEVEHLETFDSLIAVHKTVKSTIDFLMSIFVPAGTSSFESPKRRRSEQLLRITIPIF